MKTPPRRCAAGRAVRRRAGKPALSDGAASFLARLGAARRGDAAHRARFRRALGVPDEPTRDGASIRIRGVSDPWLADAANAAEGRARARTRLPPRTPSATVRGRTVFARFRPGHAAHTDGRESLESRDSRSRDARGRANASAAAREARRSKTARDGDFGKSGGGATHHDGGVSGEGIAGIDEERVVAGGCRLGRAVRPAAGVRLAGAVVVFARVVAVDA